MEFFKKISLNLPKNEDGSREVEDAVIRSNTKIVSIFLTACQLTTLYAGGWLIYQGFEHGFSSEIKFLSFLAFASTYVLQEMKVADALQAENYLRD